MTHCGSKAWNYPLSRKCASHFFSPIAKTVGWSNGWFPMSLPPYSRSWGSRFSLALVQRGLETEGVPKNQVDCSRLSFLRKTSMCWKEKVCCPRCRHKLGYEPKIMAPECFLVSLYFSSERLQGWGERVSCFSCLSRLCISRSPENKQKKKMGKLVLQARNLMRISALSTSVTKLNYLGSMSMNYATDHMSRRQNLWHERKRIS